MPDVAEMIEEASRELKRYRVEVNALKDGYDRQFSELETKVDRKMDQVGAALTRANFAGTRLETKSGDRQTLEHKSFTAYLQKGENALELLERKALTTGTDTSAGFLAPASFMPDVLRALVEVSPVRGLARDLRTGAGAVSMPTQTGVTSAGWMGELEQRPETSITVGMVEIQLHELGCYVDISQRLLDDAAIGVDQLVATDVGEQFGVIEGAAFSAGNGVKKPVGFLTDAAGLPFVPSLSATDIASDSLINMVYSLKTPYAANGVWIMNRNTLAAIRKLKDSANRYLWSEGAQGVVAGQPGILLGRPVEIDPSMPDVAAGTYPVAFGDWSRGYAVLSKAEGGLSIMRDPFSMAKTGIVRFHARLRVGGTVLKSEALVKLKIAAS